MASSKGASVRAMMSMSGSSRVATAAWILPTISSVLITSGALMKGQLGGCFWSSMNRPATPVFSYSRTVRITFMALP